MLPFDPMHQMVCYTVIGGRCCWTLFRKGLAWSENAWRVIDEPSVDHCRRLASTNQINRVEPVGKSTPCQNKSRAKTSFQSRETVIVLCFSSSKEMPPSFNTTDVITSYMLSLYFWILKPYIKL